MRLPATIRRLMLCCVCSGSILAQQADHRTSAATPDLEQQLYTVNGYRLRTGSFSAGTEFVILFYSASWCIHCKQIAKPLKEIYPKLRSEHPEIEFITYSMDDSVNARAEHLRQTDYPWPAIGPSAAKNAAWQIEIDGGIPGFQAFKLEDDKLTAITPVTQADQALQAVIAEAGLDGPG